MRFSLLVVCTVIASGSAAAQQPGRCGGHFHGDRVLVAKSSATCPWAFKPSTITLLCYRDGDVFAVFVEADGKKYPLNGNAKGDARASGLRADISEIEQRAPPSPGKLPGELVLTGPWIQAGLDVCRAGGTQR
jgi:hypothetical protein